MPFNKDRILYQDDSLLAVHKLSGELTVRGKGEVGKLPLYDFLRPHFPGIRPVNRLDFETSGIVLFAKTKEVLETILQKGLADWKKIYRTIVVGYMPQSKGSIRRALPTRTKQEDLVEAHTQYTVLRQFPDCAYLEAVIAQGRHHQIRRHLAAIGHPLALDPLYGEKKLNIKFTKRYGYRKFFLHAYSLECPHPATGQRLTIVSPMPAAFEEALRRIESGGRRADTRG